MEKQKIEQGGPVEMEEAAQVVERWETLELAFHGVGTYENPFAEVDLTARFVHEESGRTVEVDGFYDGEGIWRVRFMLLEQGKWRYETRSDDPGLNGQTGELTCLAAGKPFLHGPLRPDGFHFRHADGTRRFLISTRVSCHFTPAEELRELVRFLKEHRINRVFFMMGGVHDTIHCLYGEDRDFSRYSLDKFQAIDAFIDLLREHDIVASPYFYYFNDRVQRDLTPEQDRAYIRYGMARFGAYSNVMPVLANEVDQKFTDRDAQYDPASWTWANEMGAYMKKKAVFGVPVTVHNPLETEVAINPGFYTLLRDWPFAWADCMLRQAQISALSAAESIGDNVPEHKVPTYNVRGYARQYELLSSLRRFGIPVVNEEPGYEMGGLNWDASIMEPGPWNTQTCDTLLATFWTAVAAGAYVMWGHPATYFMDDPLSSIRDRLTPKYLRVLHDFVERLPYWEMEPDGDAVSPGDVMIEGEPWRTNFCLSKKGELYLVVSLYGGIGEINLPNGSAYSGLRLDPRTGETAELADAAGGSHRFELPAGEWVVLFRRIS